jgi:hypothetical protein
MSGLSAVWGRDGIQLWDIFLDGKWLGSRRTYAQACAEHRARSALPKEGR